MWNRSVHLTSHRNGFPQERHRFLVPALLEVVGAEAFEAPGDVRVIPAVQRTDGIRHFRTGVTEQRALR